MMKIRSRIRAAFLQLALAAVYLSGAMPATAGTLLPNGEQYFTDNNGLPLSSGCVFFYVPGTTSPKATYQDAAQTIANTNPVQLDAAGRAIIYGTGTYRQIVTSVGSAGSCSPAGPQIWDQITADTSSSITIYAGASAGTPNSITVNAPAFSGSDGQVINYISTNTNSGGATINPSGFGAVQIVRDSATGPGALTGGELVATNAVSLIYDATAGTFHILSPVTWPNTSGVPVGTSVDVRGFLAPTNYAFTYGQAVNRTAFAALFATLTSTQTGSISSGSPIITGLTDTTQYGKGMPVEAVGIQAGATVLSCTSTTCTLSSNATITRSGTMTFFAYGDGDGANTFNLPDDRGKILVTRDNLGGTAANITQLNPTLTTTSTSTSATVSSATGLQLGMFIINANVVPGTTITAINGTTITMSAAASGSAIAAPARFSVFPDPQALGSGIATIGGALVTANLPPYTPGGSIGNTVNPGAAGARGGAQQAVAGTSTANLMVDGGLATITVSSTFSGNAQGGTSVPVSILQASNVINRAIKLTP